MRRLARLAACAFPALALAACGRPDAEAKPDPAATAAPEPPPNPTVGPLAVLDTRSPQGGHPAGAAPAAETWNATQIDWQPYEAGLAKAKAEKKPVCLVLYTGWCPHCRNYSRVFDDANVVERAKRFVMIKLNADERHDVATKYQPDGGYVPRTFFLSSDGALAPEIHAPRPKYQYFFDERNPASILGGMDEALRKLAR